MYLGKIMEIGPAEQVIRDPHNPYTQALVSVSPSPDPPSAGTRAKRTILEGETPDAAHIPTGCRFHPALSRGVRPLPGRGAAAVRRGRWSVGRVLAGRAVDRRWRPGPAGDAG